MKAAPNGPFFDPRRLSIEDLTDPDRAEEALTHWEELEPNLLTAIESHPQHGPRLSMLRRADRWLDRNAPKMRPAGPCPSSEELYDFGRGPGFGPLASARRGEIERHLKACRECENLVETLAALPPVPIATGAPISSGAVGDMNATGEELASDRGTASGRETDWRQATPAQRRGLRALPRLVPIAAAASLIIGLGLWIALAPSGTETAAFPRTPLLRGNSGGPLFFPRDRVLHVTPAARAAFPALDGMLVFEIEAQADATSYRIDVARHGGDVFAADEGSLMKLSAAAPAVTVPSATTPSATTAPATTSGTGSAPISIRATAELAAGQYTWSARATVHGLDQELGQRDFTVVDDAEVSAQLEKLASQAEPARSLAAVRFLHEHGFLGEARAIARAMPASPERDSYLSQVPGR
jgi:hypothetical protein